MKYIIIPLVLMLFACDDGETSEQTISLEITPNNLTLYMEAGSGNAFFTIKSDKTVIVQSDHPEWCVPSISNTTIDNLKISVSENDTFVFRKAVITVSNDSGNRNIIVNQAGLQPMLSTDRINVVLQFGKPEFALEVTSNFSFVFALPDWISEIDGNEWKNGKKIYSFIASPLPDELSYRNATISIIAHDNSLEVTPYTIAISQKTIPKVIAHRGYWDIPNYPQNSLASLKRAIELGVYGSELDVWITTDGVVVLNHDASIEGISIEQSSYSDLAKVLLSNGEPIPTLEKYIETVKVQDQTKLIIEIKTHSTEINNIRAVAAVLQLVDQKEANDLVDYIAFSQTVCKELISRNPNNRVAYLNGNIAPEYLKNEGYWGMDYAMSVLKPNTEWIILAMENGLKTNVWTVNSIDDFEYYISKGVDFITTDYPQNLKELILSKSTP